MNRFKVEFTYDGQSRLRTVTTYTWLSGTWYSGGEKRYLYDGMLIVQERDGSNVPQVSYVRGKDLSGSLEGAGGIGGLLARSSGYSSGSWSTHDFYHADGNGNITAMVDGSGTLRAYYRYNPFGRYRASGGAIAGANTMRFSSKPWVAFQSSLTEGLYYYGYRFYDPYLQRWVNRDPIDEEGGNNLYESVSNAPLNECDPDGRLCLTMYLCSLVPGSGNLVGTKIRCMYSCTLVAKVGFCKQRPDPGIFVIDAEPFPPPCNRFGQPVVCSRVFAFKVW